jgi:hypothetical protein
VQVLARALGEHYRRKRDERLARYSETCLKRMWLFAIRPLARCPRSGKPKPLCTNRTASPPRRVSEPLTSRGLGAKEFPIPIDGAVSAAPKVRGR